MICCGWRFKSFKSIYCLFFIYRPVYVIGSRFNNNVFAVVLLSNTIIKWLASKNKYTWKFSFVNQNCFLRTSDGYNWSTGGEEVKIICQNWSLPMIYRRVVCCIRTSVRTFFFGHTTLWDILSKTKKSHEQNKKKLSLENIVYFTTNGMDDMFMFFMLLKMSWIQPRSVRGGWSTYYSPV